MKSVFITGISGLLGTNLANHLLSKGYRVTGLVRTVKSYRGDTHANLNLIEGTLFDDFSTVLQQTDYVVHSAAITAQHLLSYAGYHLINCDATAHLARQCVQCGVKRFIYISSANTAGHGSLSHPGNESFPVKAPFDGSYYAMSKMAAEKYLLTLSDRLEVIILNPGFMLGANDSKPSSGRIVQMGLGRKWLFYPPGGKSFVYVGDVVKAIEGAFTNGLVGDRYLLAAENLSFKAFFQKLSLVTGHTPFMIKVPKTVLLLAGYAGDLLRMAGVSSAVNSVNMRILCCTNYYSGAKASDAFSIKYTPIDTAIAETVQYFKTNFKSIKN